MDIRLQLFFSWYIIIKIKLFDGLIFKYNERIKHIKKWIVPFIFNVSF
jgi:hypothetical protein